MYTIESTYCWYSDWTNKHERIVLMYSINGIPFTFDELEDLDKAPRVLAGADGRLIMGAGGKVYARGDFGDEVANAYGIYRKGQVYVDPETEEVLGLEATEIGVGSVAGKEGNIATLLLERTAQQVSIGDVLLPTDDRELISNYYPRAPKGKLTGEILAVDGGVSQVGQFDVVVLNRGERDGLEPGSVLLIMKKGEIVYDRIKDEQVRLPSERAGSLMVFLTYEKMSYALIMRANRPLRIGDEVVNPNN